MDHCWAGRDPSSESDNAGDRDGSATRCWKASASLVGELSLGRGRRYSMVAGSIPYVIEYRARARVWRLHPLLRVVGQPRTPSPIKSPSVTKPRRAAGFWIGPPLDHRNRSAPGSISKISSRLLSPPHQVDRGEGATGLDAGPCGTDSASSPGRAPYCPVVFAHSV